MKMTLDDLKSKYAKHSITMTLQCAGNRRSEMHAAREVKGLQWTNCTITTATWSGARISDVLRDISTHHGPDAVHVQFVGLDCDITGAARPYCNILAEKSYCLSFTCASGEA